MAGCWARYRPIPKDELVDDAVLLARVADVVKKYASRGSKAAYWNGGEAPWMVDRNNENRKKLSDLSTDDWILKVKFYDRKDLDRPDEIIALFEVFLFIKDRKMNKDVFAIDFDYSKEHDSEISLITVTMEEFEEMYRSIERADKSDAEIADELAEMWLDNHLYNREGLQYSEEEKFKEKLITQWNTDQWTEDALYRGFYMYDINKFSIAARDVWVEGGDYKSYPFLTVNEEGYMYGAWDGYDLWFYGETSGITIWHDTGGRLRRHYDEDKMPSELKEVKKWLEKRSDS
jgi:hypothetical protein